MSEVRTVNLWRYCFKFLDADSSLGFAEIRFLKWRNVNSSNPWFFWRYQIGFHKVCLYSSKHFFHKIKKILTKSIFHVSNLNVIALDPPTKLRQFEVNCANIRYVSDPLLYPVIKEDQFQANSKKNLMGHFRSSETKPTNYYQCCYPEKL